MTTTSVSVSTDDDGFLSQECPSCERLFKAKFGEGSPKPIGFCPYCGHAGTDCWWTSEQVEFLQGAVIERMVNPILDDFARSVNRSNRPGSLIRFSAKVNHDVPAPAPVESNDPMPIMEFKCCGESVKHDGSASTLHCVICGTQSAAA